MIFLLSIEMFFLIIFLGPKLFGINPFVVTSGSMEPKYPVGSIVYSKKTEMSKITNKDAITFYMSGKKTIATHQVYLNDTENKIIRTYGINNKDENGKTIYDAMPVKYENVIGKTLFCIPYLGFVNRYVTTAPGMYIVLFITFIVILASVIIEKRINMEVNNEKTKQEKSNNS